MALEIPLLDKDGFSGKFSLPEAMFDRSFNETLIHQLVVRYLAGGRSGTKSQKTRSDVSGGGVKPWRQKGTGRARSGTTRSPIWRTGGVTFAANTRNYEQKLNKKMFKVGVHSILSELLRQNRLVLGEESLCNFDKTKSLSQKLSSIDAKRIVILVQDTSVSLVLAARNIPYVDVISASNLNPVMLVSAEKVIITPSALKQLEGYLL